jgi:gamma-glutamylcyclotransferase (GGCT)/AIG2-like uncharacterized protein YtfP
MFYFAYGMNTNRTSMTWRCPGAISFGLARLLDHEFRFSYHADVVVSPGESVNGVLWLIDEDHLADLDTLEGYPGYYNRAVLPVEYQGNIIMAECYRMQPDHPGGAPSQGYLDMILEGYGEYGIPEDQIWTALDQTPPLFANYYLAKSQLLLLDSVDH